MCYKYITIYLGRYKSWCDVETPSGYILTFNWCTYYCTIEPRKECPLKARITQGGIHKLCRQYFALYWPPTHPLLTFVKENLSTVDIFSTTAPKGQIISKGLFGILGFLQRTNEQILFSTVRQKKMNSFVRFLEESNPTPKVVSKLSDLYLPRFVNVVCECSLIDDSIGTLTFLPYVTYVD